MDKSQQELKAGYYRYRFERALAITDESIMRAELARLVVNAAHNDFPLPLAAAERIKSFLLTPEAKQRGGQFKTRENARRAGQVEVLMIHCGMNQNQAADLVAAAHSKKSNSGDRKLHNAREAHWKAAWIDSAGNMSWRPTGDATIDAMMFLPREIALLLKSIRPDRHPAKQIKDFFRKTS